MEEQQNINIEVKNPEQNGNKGTKRFLLVTWEFLQIVIVAAAIVLPIRYFIFQPFIVKGDSMVPNFHSGDYLIIDEISYQLSMPSRGDVVVFHYPVDPSQRFIKRMIGLPGETVEIKGNKITISKDGNKITLDEKAYLTNVPPLGDKTVTLKADEYFVMGDNRQYSYDSRGWGVLPKKDMIGRAAVRLFPINHLNFLSTPTY